MNEEIYFKLHAALYPISPLASDREKIIEKLGEAIWFESLEKTLLSLPEDKRNEAVVALNSDKLSDAIKILEESSVDVEAIIVETAKSLMDEINESIK